MNEPCPFCLEYRFSINRKLKLPAAESIIWEDENVYVAPDLFPISVGHMLVCSKFHYNSFGCAHTSTVNSAKKALDFLKSNIFIGQNFIIFEHGSVIKNSAGVSIDHAHLHIIPININLQIEIENSALIESKAEPCTLDGLYKFGNEQQPYIYCESQSNPPIVFRVKSLPSQFLRKLISDKLQQEYNWKISIGDPSFRKRFIETIKKYGGYNG